MAIHTRYHSGMASRLIAIGLLCLIGAPPQLARGSSVSPNKAQPSGLTSPRWPGSNDRVAVPEYSAIPCMPMMLSEIEFDHVDFSDVIDFFQDISGGKFVVDWKALEAVGVKRDTPVTTKVSHVRFSKGLDIVLNSVGTGKAKLGFKIEKNAFTISTR